MKKPNSYDLAVSIAAIKKQIFQLSEDIAHCEIPEKGDKAYVLDKLNHLSKHCKDLIPQFKAKTK